MHLDTYFIARVRALLIVVCVTIATPQQSYTAAPPAKQQQSLWARAAGMAAYVGTLGYYTGGTQPSVQQAPNASKPAVAEDKPDRAASPGTYEDTMAMYAQLAGQASGTAGCQYGLMAGSKLGGLAGKQQPPVGLGLSSGHAAGSSASSSSAAVTVGSSVSSSSAAAKHGSTAAPAHVAQKKPVDSSLPSGHAGAAGSSAASSSASAGHGSPAAPVAALAAHITTSLLPDAVCLYRGHTPDGIFIEQAKILDQESTASFLGAYACGYHVLKNILGIHYALVDRDSGKAQEYLQRPERAEQLFGARGPWRAFVMRLRNKEVLKEYLKTFIRLDGNTQEIQDGFQMAHVAGRYSTRYNAFIENLATLILDTPDTALGVTRQELIGAILEGGPVRDITDINAYRTSPATTMDDVIGFIWHRTTVDSCARLYPMQTGWFGSKSPVDSLALPAGSTLVRQAWEWYTRMSKERAASKEHAAGAGYSLISNGDVVNMAELEGLVATYGRHEYPALAGCTVVDSALVPFDGSPDPLSYKARELNTIRRELRTAGPVTRTTLHNFVINDFYLDEDKGICRDAGHWTGLTLARLPNGTRGYIITDSIAKHGSKQLDYGGCIRVIRALEDAHDVQDLRATDYKPVPH